MRVVTLCTLAALTLAASGALAFETLTFKDPRGDDRGPGSYSYPTHAVYTKGSFDLLEMTVEDAGDDIRFTVTVATRIEDPWDSKSWPGEGKGWSLQMIQIYVDTDNKPKSGFRDALPGINVRFEENSYWNKMILISPQPDSRIRQEISAKAGDMADSIILPRLVSARGRRFVALVRKSDLGEPQKGWGWQVIMQSNEGYPTRTDLLTRRVNEFNGEHRFGGGNDFDCDPHAIDILVPPAKGETSERDAQYRALQYKCDPDDPESTDGQAVIPMVYR